MTQLENTNMETEGPRVACIDCGTNSVKMIIAEWKGGQFQRVFENSATTRIGEGMQANGMQLGEEPMRRTLGALVEFASQAKEHKAGQIAMVGTAALRDAHNRQEFVQLVKEQCDLTLEIIPGEEEARLSFLAVRRDPHWINSPRLLVIDIGGGSTEVIQGQAHSDAVASRVSINLGAVKLTEGYLKSDPPDAEQLAKAHEAATDAFSRTASSHPGETPFHVVGVGGTFTNIGAMLIGEAAEPEQLHGLTLRINALEQLSARLAGLSVEQRRQIPGLDPRRADIILGGVILLTHALAHIGSDRIDVSTRGLRWGVLYDRFSSLKGTQ
jgi:exopolyphosphatase/guanosine-5'-triphosphate,3'-diphosphate pyrophosphatase